MILAIVTDLMFLSTIRAETDRAGVPLMKAKSVEDAAALGNNSIVRRIMVDLNSRGLDPFAAIEALPPAARSLVVAFHSHVDKDLATKAKALGIPEIMPRSKFVEQLPELVAAIAK